MRPRSYALLFCYCDFFVLILQVIRGCNGGDASTGGSNPSSPFLAFVLEERGREEKEMMRTEE